MHTDGKAFSATSPSTLKKGEHKYPPESGVYQLFAVIYSPQWHLSLIEAKDYDISSLSMQLQILGMQLQRDPIFLRDFFELDGARIIESRFSGEELSIDIVLPLIAIAFQIPLKLIIDSLPADESVVRNILMHAMKMFLCLE